MWDELGKQIALEQEQLNRLIDTHRALVLRCAVEPPNDVELQRSGSSYIRSIQELKTYSSVLLLS